jgi:hypothetical protein
MQNSFLLRKSSWHCSLCNTEPCINVGLHAVVCVCACVITWCKVTDALCSWIFSSALKKNLYWWSTQIYWCIHIRTAVSSMNVDAHLLCSLFCSVHIFSATCCMYCDCTCMFLLLISCRMWICSITICIALSQMLLTPNVEKEPLTVPSVFTSQSLVSTSSNLEDNAEGVL